MECAAGGRGGNGWHGERLRSRVGARRRRVRCIEVGTAPRAVLSAKVSGKIQVTGDSHQGIGLSGVGFSAIGHRLRVPAAESRNEFLTANRFHLIHASPLVTVSPCPRAPSRRLCRRACFAACFPNRQPLTANRFPLNLPTSPYLCPLSWRTGLRHRLHPCWASASGRWSPCATRSGVRAVPWLCRDSSSRGSWSHRGHP